MIVPYVDNFNNQRYHVSLESFIPADVCFGRREGWILKYRMLLFTFVGSLLLINKIGLKGVF